VFVNNISGVAVDGKMKFLEKSFSMFGSVRLIVVYLWPIIPFFFEFVLSAIYYYQFIYLNLTQNYEKSFITLGCSSVTARSRVRPAAGQW
jgi:hypothetical protein